MVRGNETKYLDVRDILWCLSSATCDICTCLDDMRHESNVKISRHSIQDGSRGTKYVDEMLHIEVASF